MVAWPTFPQTYMNIDAILFEISWQQTNKQTKVHSGEYVLHLVFDLVLPCFVADVRYMEWSNFLKHQQQVTIQCYETSAC